MQPSKLTRFYKNPNLRILTGTLRLNACDSSFSVPFADENFLNRNLIAPNIFKKEINMLIYLIIENKLGKTIYSDIN